MVLYTFRTMLSERQAQILEAAVREFIETGEPVSSGLLFERHRFGIRPAMIRLELNDLADEGYLEQPHHSAGRVPTNRGFEFFANRVLEEDGAATRLDPGVRNLFEHRAWPELVERLSDDLGLLGAAADFSEHRTYKDGLENLIDHLEWRSREMITSVIRDFEELDRRLGRADALFGDDDLRVFVGRKSPVTTCPELAVMAARYDEDGRRIAIFAIGPKRMDYRKAARILRGLKREKHKNDEN
jgi:transcriptional regulator of heat shock response